MVSKEFKYKASPTTNLKLFSFSDQNLMRVVEVWFDDWKKYFYQHKPHLKGLDFGDISKQLARKERLQCKNFTYFMTEVAPDILQYYPPVEPDPGAVGAVSTFGNFIYQLQNPTS